MKDLRRINVVDVEATCWDESDPCPAGEETEIIEIGITVLDLRTFERSDKTSILVQPRRSRVGAFCTRLTTLTQRQVEADGVSYETACAMIVGHFHGTKRPWCSWGAYDRDMFELEARRRVMAGTASLAPQEHRKASQTLLGWPPEVYPFSRQHTNMKQVLSLLGGRFDGEFGMAHACAKAGIALEGTHHRGCDDSWNIAGIVAWMLGRTRGAFDLGGEAP